MCRGIMDFLNEPSKEWRSLVDDVNFLQIFFFASRIIQGGLWQSTIF